METRNVTLDSMLLRYVTTGEALAAAQLPCVVHTARWLHINALGGLWVIDQDQGYEHMRSLFFWWGLWSDCLQVSLRSLEWQKELASFL